MTDRTSRIDASQLAHAVIQELLEVDLRSGFLRDRSDRCDRSDRSDREGGLARPQPGANLFIQSDHIEFAQKQPHHDNPTSLLLILHTCGRTDNPLYFND